MDFGASPLDTGAFKKRNLKKRAKSNRYCVPKKSNGVKSINVKYNNAETLAKDISSFILNGDRVNCILSGNFIFGDFFEAFAVTNNLLIDEIQLSTLSMSKENIDSFENMLKGGCLKSLKIIVSDYFWSHNRHNAKYIFEKLDINDSFQLAISGTHTKIALIKIGAKKIVITGSANLRSSRSIEEICIEENPCLFDFHYEWQEQVISKYATINKAVRGEKLFNQICKGVEGKDSWDQK